MAFVIFLAISNNNKEFLQEINNNSSIGRPIQLKNNKWKKYKITGTNSKSHWIIINRFIIKIYLECAYAAASTRILCGHIDLKICILSMYTTLNIHIIIENRFIGLCALPSHIRYNMKYNISVFRIMLVLQYVFYTSLAECKVISKIKSHLLCCKLTMFMLYYTVYMPLGVVYADEQSTRPKINNKKKQKPFIAKA